MNMTSFWRIGTLVALTGFSLAPTFRPRVAYGGPETIRATDGPKDRPEAAVALYHTRASGLWRLDLATGRSRQVAAGRVGVYLFSPDGRSIAYTDTRSGGIFDSDGLYVVGARGGASRRLAEMRGGGIGGFTWSPDGGSIAYIDGTAPSDEDGLDGLHLSVVELRTGATRELGRYRYIDSELRWDAAGGALYFRDAMGGQNAVRVDAKTGRNRRVNVLPPLHMDQVPLLDCYELYASDERPDAGRVEIRYGTGEVLHHPPEGSGRPSWVIYRYPNPRRDEWGNFVPENVAWLPDGLQVVFSVPRGKVPLLRACLDRNIMVVDVRTGECKVMRSARNPGWYDPTRRGATTNELGAFPFYRTQIAPATKKRG